jgi:hypothetical protein
VYRGGRVPGNGRAMFSQSKSRMVKPSPKEQRFNYLIDISTKWHRQFLYVNGTYFCPGPDQGSPTFDTGFVRLHYLGVDQFNVASMRHTEKWWQIVSGMTLKECLNAIEINPIFFPCS